MNSVRFSVLLDRIDLLHPSIPGQEVHGANLSIQFWLEKLIQDDRVECMEIFLRPGEIASSGAVEAAVKSVLPKNLRGKGKVEVKPIFSLPETWGDGRERVIMSLDPCLISRDRIFRDDYAVGPSPILAMTHSLGRWDYFDQLRPLREMTPCPADHAVCLSHDYEQALIRTFSHCFSPGQQPFSTSVLPHFVDLEFFAPATPAMKRQARISMRLPVEGRIAVFTGRLTPHSKADLMPLLRSFEAASGSNDHLLIAGVVNTPGYWQSLAAEADRLGMEGRVHFRLNNSRAETVLALQAADIYVFPGDTMQEALANANLEAMACGLPTIVSDWDGMKDNVVEGETGFKIPTVLVPGLGSATDFAPYNSFMETYLYSSQMVWVDEEVMTARLRELLRDEDLSAKMGDAARKRIETNYSLAAILDRYFKIVESSLELARQETADERNRRRLQTAYALPRPNYLHIFSGYASRTLSPSDTLVLTLRGEKAAAKLISLNFYDELMAQFEPRIMDLMLAQLLAGESTAQALAEAACNKYQVSIDLALFHIGLALKSGAARLK